jgi:hypothetical protein
MCTRVLRESTYLSRSAVRSSGSIIDAAIDWKRIIRANRSIVVEGLLARPPSVPVRTTNSAQAPK